jgi:hypothetical protein
MYFFDPQQGNRRRALFRDKLNRLSHDTADGLDAAWRDLQNQMHGCLAEVESLFESHEAPDEVIVQRVRSKAGRYLSHSSALEVDVAEGCVVLRGPVLATEIQPLVQAIRRVPGVCSVDNQMEVKESAADEPPLLGQGRRPNEMSDLLVGNWSPGTRLAAGATGGVLMLNCMARGSSGSMLGGLLGFGLLTRALAHAVTNQALGGPSRRGPSQQSQSRQSQNSQPKRNEREEHFQGPATPQFGGTSEFEGSWPASQAPATPGHKPEEAERFPPAM